MTTSCEHKQFACAVDVHRIVDGDGKLTGFHACIRVRCDDCKQEFVWVGVPITGMTLDGVAVSVDGTELRASLAPSFAWSGDGKDLAVRGFSVKKVI